MNTVQKQLMEFLTPMLGQETASNLLKHYCARMNLPVEAIQMGHLRELADSMKPMLAVWLGSAGAAHVSEEIAHLGGRTAAG